MARVEIVVPCYNEAHRFDGKRFEEFSRRHEQIDFLFVNDGSRDATQEILDRLAADTPDRLRVLKLPQNRGKAEAVRQGFLEALERRPLAIGFWDADLATPLEDILSFRRVLDEQPSASVVIGSRMPLLGRRIERRPARYYAGQVFTVAASLVLGVRFRDTQCGAKLFRVTPTLEQIFAAPFVSRWIFDVEIMARLARGRAGRRSLARLVYEFPLDLWRDVAGSKVLAGDFFKSAIDLARIYWTYLRPGAPWRPESSDEPRDAVPLTDMAPPVAKERQAA